MVKELWTVQEKKRLMSTILGWIRQATALNRSLSLKKLRAESSIVLGISGSKFDQYLQEFIDSERVKIDGDDVIANTQESILDKLQKNG